VSKRYAIVSIGTNSTRALLADVEPDQPRVEEARSIGTRVGEGLREGGALSDEAMQRTLDAVTAHYRAIRGHYVRIFAVGTSALRRAKNAEEFSNRLQAIVGVPLRVLSGEEEAAASYRGALTAFGTLRGERVGVLDIGGGSTEYAVGVAGTPESVVSCEIGAVRLSEEVPALTGRDGSVDEASISRARELAREALAPLRDCAPVERVALVGGSATSAAAIARERRLPAPAMALTRADLKRVLDMLVKMPLEERKGVVGMKAQRADILPAGIVVLEEALEILGQDAVVATTADLLLGILLQERDAGGQRSPALARSEARRGFRK
jgi:exopolyphosphatase / guanosine-5'-triphosphate,3'-diphosphate pyrophosphatase